MTPIELTAARAKLAAEISKLDASIAEHAAAHRSERIAEVRALMTEHGLTIADLGQTKLASVKPARAKAAPMYRDPVTGATALGKGKHPRWLRATLKAGATLDSLRITPSTADDKIAA